MIITPLKDLLIGYRCNDLYPIYHLLSHTTDTPSWTDCKAMAESKGEAPTQPVPSYERQNTDDLTELPLKIPVSEV